MSLPGVSCLRVRPRNYLHEIIHLIRSADRIPAQRDTLYRHLAVHWTPEDDPADDARIVSHFASTALPGGGVGQPLPLVATS